ncbi:unnamed protein product [Brassicogethes aeneus]|uniref:Luciferin 4-monooxygenase n=1 Tax=Brassicogethes aeneus TaxID=1431903 RepID=A0A9P0FNB3_BRAAE|nr:unnamed protein product [Brassicogethes aeneus]
MASLSRRILTRCKHLKFARFSSTSANIITSDFKDVEIPKKTIHQFFYDEITNYTNFTAVECAVTGRKYTYGQIRQKCRNLSKNVRKKLKLKQNDVVAILLPNIPEYPIAVLGLMESGILVTSLNPIYTSEEIARQMKDANVKAVITTIESVQIVKAANALNKINLPVIAVQTQSGQTCPPETIKFDEMVDVEVDMPDIVIDNVHDTAFLPYSSGTTGLPKGVDLSHYNIVGNIKQTTSKEMKFLTHATESYQDCMPAVLPFFHIYGFTITLLQGLVHGAKLVTLPKFTPELYTDVLKKNKITLIIAAPPLVLFLSAHPLVKKEYMANLKAVMSGAAPLGASDEERFLEKVGGNVEISQGYGLTETSPVVSMISQQLKDKFNCTGSIGGPIPNTQMKLVAIDDATGTPLGPNQQGELFVKGPQVMKGYFNKPKETEEVFQDGWFKTGDLMYYNEDNLFFVTDRLKELIKVKGFQVAPAELEEILRSVPNVSDAAVIGIPHPLSGEVPRAYIVPKPNAKLNEEEIKATVAERVAPYKQLKGGIEIVAAIPKNATGKILRRQLKLEYLEKNA